MEITNILLNELGADPKVYSDEEKMLMGDYADKIIAGDLASLLSCCALPEEKLAELKAEYGENRDALLDNMKKIADRAESLAGVFVNKSSIFASALPDLEKEELLMKAFGYMQSIINLREDTLNRVAYIYRGMTELYELQNVYNTTLATLGMINIAAKVAETAGAVYDEDAIMTPIMEAYEKLTDFTAFTNDLKDKAVIYEKATEVSLGYALDALAIHLDLMGDGKNLSVSGVGEDAASIKRIAESVLHTHI